MLQRRGANTQGTCEGELIRKNTDLNIILLAAIGAKG